MLFVMTFYDDDPAQFVGYAVQDLIRAVNQLADPIAAWQAFLVDFMWAIVEQTNWARDPVELLVVMARRRAQEIILSL